MTKHIFKKTPAERQGPMEKKTRTWFREQIETEATRIGRDTEIVGVIVGNIYTGAGAVLVRGDMDTEWLGAVLGDASIDFDFQLARNALELATQKLAAAKTAPKAKRHKAARIDEYDDYEESPDDIPERTGRTQVAYSDLFDE